MMFLIPFHRAFRPKVTVFWDFWQTFPNGSEVLAASINRLMTDAASTSETSLNFYQATQRPRRQPSLRMF
jgi:hypothetical protein